METTVIQSIKSSYPKIISKDQLYRICHISKKTALYLLESGAIPSVNSGKKTRKYKIQIDDVITFLQERDNNPLAFKPPENYYKGTNGGASLRKRIFIPQELMPEARAFFEEKLKRKKDVLTTSEVSKITGYHSLSDDMCEDCLFELIMNSVQEFQIGEATKIEIKVSKGTYEISDNGSGIAVEDSKKFRDFEWKRMLVYPGLIFEYPDLFPCEETCDSNSILDSKYYLSGYYKKAPKYHYKMSLPKSKEAPGSSLAHAQCYAKSMRITTIRGLNKFSFAFENGYCTSGRIICDAKDGEKGTHIVWSPDECCFYNTIVSFESLSAFLERQAFLNPGLKITLDYNGLKHDYCFLNGIKDYLATRICDLMLPITGVWGKYFPSERKSNSLQDGKCLAGITYSVGDTPA